MLRKNNSRLKRLLQKNHRRQFYHIKLPPVNRGFPYLWDFLQLCIICDMDRKQLTKLLNNQTLIIWDNLCELYPRLTRYNPPIIEVNGRLYRTAGRCHQEDNIIQLGFKFFNYSLKYRDIMTDIILPHEIIHQADYNLFGLSEAKCGHGKKWQEIMINYGLSPDKHHSMWIK